MTARKPLILTLTLGILSVGAALAGTEARLHGVVSASDGEPIVGATITVTTDSLTTFREVWKTNKKGKYSGILGDATFTYHFLIEKAGYSPTKGDIKAGLESTEKHDFVLYAEGAAPAASTAAPNPATLASGAAVNLYNEGASALREGDFVTARQKLEAALEKDSQLAPAHGALALTLIQLKDFAAAAAAADQALAINPAEASALQARYAAYTGLGDKAKATEAAEALASAGQNADAARRVFNEGATALREGSTAAAIGKFEEAARLDPSLTPASDALAGLYFAEKRYEDAVKAAEQTLTGDPGSLKSLRIRAEAYRLLGDQDKALEALSALAAADPEMDAGVIHNQGVAAFNDGKMDLAIAAFQLAVTVDPTNAPSYYSLGLAFVNQSENAKAKEAFQHFVELAPDSPDAATAKEMMKYL